MSNDSSAIISKVWNYAHVLKNAGAGYGDYVEQSDISSSPIRRRDAKSVLNIIAL